MLALLYKYVFFILLTKKTNLDVLVLNNVYNSKHNTCLRNKTTQNKCFALKYIVQKRNHNGLSSIGLGPALNGAVRVAMPKVGVIFKQQYGTVGGRTHCANRGNQVDGLKVA